MTDFVEEAYILTGKRKGPALAVRRHAHTSGTYGTVNFDYAWMEKREDARRDIVGMWHSHPPGVGARPSETDRVTMEGWVDSIGRSLLCVIQSGQKVRVYLYRKTGGVIELSIRKLFGGDYFIVWGGERG